MEDDEERSPMKTNLTTLFKRWNAEYFQMLGELAWKTLLDHANCGFSCKTLYSFVRWFTINEVHNVNFTSSLHLYGSHCSHLQAAGEQLRKCCESRNFNTVGYWTEDSQRTFSQRTRNRPVFRAEVARWRCLKIAPIAVASERKVWEDKNSTQRI